MLAIRDGRCISVGFDADRQQAGSYEEQDSARLMDLNAVRHVIVLCIEIAFTQQPHSSDL